MRAFVIAIALFLTIPALALGAPSADAAAHYPVPPFAYVEQSTAAVSPTVIFGASTSQGAAWNCGSSVSAPGSFAADVIVTCTSATLSNFEGKCLGMRVGAQSGSDPVLTGTVGDIIEPVMAPPAPVWNPLAGATRMTVDGVCQGGPSAGVDFYTPGADADLGLAGTSAGTFTCTVHVDEAVKATPWNAFCYGV